MADYDAIVVGGGHNGLICAVYLTLAGWRTLVVEQSQHLGGGLRTAELTLPGYRHDLFATNVGFLAGSPVYRELKPKLDKIGLQLLQTQLPYASVHTGGSTRVYADLDLTEREIAASSKEDVLAWRRLVKLFRGTASTFLPLFYTELPSLGMLRQAARLLIGGPDQTARLARILVQSSRQFVNQHFESCEVQSLMASWAYHLDCGPDVKGGATFAFVAALSGHLNGLFLAKGGAGEITGALAQLVEAHGGQIRMGCEVSRIKIRDGVAIAVETKSGDVFTAGRAIVANVTPRLLFGRLVPPDQLESRFFRKISKFRYGPGTFVVHLALDRRPDWPAGEDLGDFNYVHVCGSVAEIAQTYNQCLRGLLPSRPLLVVSQTTPTDPSRAPAGKHVMRIHVRTVPSLIAGDAAGEIGATTWMAAKEPFAERLLDLVEVHCPDLRSHILARAVFTPEDVENLNPNFIGGDCVSGSHHLDQNFLWRPIFGWSRYTTPIDHLYMIGASTWPGGGINGGSGYLLAKRLVAQDNDKPRRE